MLFSSNLKFELLGYCFDMFNSLYWNKNHDALSFLSIFVSQLLEVSSVTLVVALLIRRMLLCRLLLPLKNLLFRLFKNSFNVGRNGFTWVAYNYLSPCNLNFNHYFKLKYFNVTEFMIYFNPQYRHNFNVYSN